jgi:jagged-1
MHLSSQSCNDESSTVLPKVVAMLGELLSRPKRYIKDSYLIDYPEIIALNAIAEIKVETAITNENIEKEAYLLIAFVGVLILIISSVIYTICLWQANHTICSRQSEIDLSVTDTTRCHEEEKSNNLQNEENFRRYANPLKNSTCSLRSSNVELNPIQDLAGPSGMNRSHLSILKNPKDFGSEFESKAAISSQSLYKTQNSDVDKNTIQGIESQHSSKDFDKCINKVDFKCLTASSTHFNGSISNNNTHQAINNVNSNETLTLHI